MALVEALLNSELHPVVQLTLGLFLAAGLGGGGVAWYRARYIDRPKTMAEIIDNSVVTFEKAAQQMDNHISRLGNQLDEALRKIDAQAAEIQALRQQVSSLRLQNAEVHDLRAQVSALETALTDERRQHDAHHNTDHAGATDD